MGVMVGKGYSPRTPVALLYDDDREAIVESGVSDAMPPAKSMVKTFVNRNERELESCKGSGCNLTEVPRYDNGAVPNMSSVMSSGLEVVSLGAGRPGGRFGA